MESLEAEVKNCELEIKAGHGGEDSDVYAWVNSRVPEWAKTVDDPVYRLYTGSALETAKKIVRQTGEHITLKMNVKYRP